jgi:hypothetical protein
MNKQLKPCPLCGSGIGVQIITGKNCNGKVYRVICWGDRCKHKLPTEYYENRQEAIKAWNSLKSTEIISMNCDNKRISNDFPQKSVNEIIDAITSYKEFDRTFLQTKIKEILMKICQNCHYNF